jgi:uncharacterized protein (TIGR03435 family)
MLMKRSAVLRCVGVGVAVALAFAPFAAAQSSPSFEVASIRPSNPNPAGPLAGAPMILPALGRLTAQNVTLRMLVMGAYQKQPFEMVGGPSWWNSEKFDINARAGDASGSTDAILGMLKTLLADRFKLKAHTETREVPVYHLVLARGDGKLGQKMKASTDNCPDFKAQQQAQLEAIAKGGLSALTAMVPKPGEPAPPCAITPLPRTTPGSISMKATGQAIPTLTLLLTQLVGRPVVDKTGLTGLYDFELTIDMQTLMRIYADLGVNMQLPPNLPEGPSLMTLLQEDLGLKLDSQRGPGEVLVIDSAELPTPD